MISAIVAADKNMAIGVNGGMLCHIPGDLKYFKNVTMGCVMVVGRKTYDGLPVKPLPGRDHIVITRAADNGLTPVQDRVFKTNLQGAMDYLSSHRDENLFVIGGYTLPKSTRASPKRTLISPICRTRNGPAQARASRCAKMTLPTAFAYMTENRKRHPKRMPFIFTVFCTPRAT